MRISRPDATIGKCRMIRHSRDQKNEPNPQRLVLLADKCTHSFKQLDSLSTHLIFSRCKHLIEKIIMLKHMYRVASYTPPSKKGGNSTIRRVLWFFLNGSDIPLKLSGAVSVKQMKTTQKERGRLFSCWVCVTLSLAHSGVLSWWIRWNLSV